MHLKLRLLFRILIGSIIPRDGATDQISWDHKNFLYFLVNETRMNLDAYIFNHLYKSIQSCFKKHTTPVPYGRVLSELFYQCRLVEVIEKTECVQDLKEAKGSILFVAILVHMNLKKGLGPP
ncbi:hypothetical protein P8452_08446 [Trifolium repens]|nr:hypothetical protein P8452_08446 [Trifolium repens]